jgi:4-alpha-glucanotransferase
MPAYRTSEKAELLEHFASRIDHEAKRVGPGGIVRLDHLLGAAQPYYVPVEGRGAADAKAGFATLFTGAEFKGLLDRFPQVRFVGEDLGDLTPGRAAFMDELAPSRMRVGLQSLMEGVAPTQSAHFADNVAATDVIFTGGTHDYPFLRTYLTDHWDDAPVRQLRDVLAERGLASRAAGVAEAADGAMLLNLQSKAGTAISQVFDVLGMGGDATLAAHLRAFNTPGSAGAANWATRIPERALGAGRGAFVDALASMAKLSNRV